MAPTSWFSSLRRGADNIMLLAPTSPHQTSPPLIIFGLHGRIVQRDAQCTPWLMGDLNINLVHPKDEREEEIVEECGFMGLTDMSRHFPPAVGKS